MKKQNFLWFLMLAISLNSNATVPGRNVYIDETEHREIFAGCEELRKLGNVGQLISRIDANTENVLRIMKYDDPMEDLAEITRLTSAVKKDADLLVSILESRFTEQNYVQSILWRLEDPKMDVSELTDAYVLDANTFKGPETLLKNQVDFKIIGDTVFAQLTRPASLVEICQLQQAMMITSRVEFNYKRNHKKAKSLRFRMVGDKIKAPVAQQLESKEIL